MASRSLDVLDALATLIRATSSFAGTGAVKVGRSSLADTLLPAAWVAHRQLDAEVGPDLTGYRWTLDLDLEVRVAPSTQTPEGRYRAAVTALDEIVTAIEGSRTLGGLVCDVTVSGAVIDGDEVGLGQVGIAGAAIRAWWLTDQGEGL